MKNTLRFASVVLDTNSVEIKYSKVHSVDSKAVYMVFVSDVSAIKYSNGNYIDYSERCPKIRIETDYFPIVFKWCFEVGYSFFKPKITSDFLEFWQYRNQNNNLNISFATREINLVGEMKAALGPSQRNWFGAVFSYNFSPGTTITAKNYYHGQNELQLDISWFAISFNYGHSLNFKKNVIAGLDLGIGGANLSGNMMLFDEKHDVSGMSSMKLHTAIGCDWIVNKHLFTGFRIGYHNFKIEESHKDEHSSTGYSAYYVSNTNRKLLEIPYSGFYMSLRLAFTINQKLRG